MSDRRPGILFVLWEELHRALHWRKYRQHKAYVQALNAWQDGEGPRPDIREYRFDG